jgi:hypothetical protein
MMAEVKMSGLMKFIYAAFALWGLIFIIIFGFGSNAVFQVIRGLWPLLTLPIALVFSLLSLIAIFTEKRRIQPLIILLLSAIALATFKKTSGWGAWMNFQLHKSGYESMVTKVLTARSEEERKKICDGGCAVYHEDVVSLSFDYSAGFLNWTQIIYDPIGVPRPPKAGVLHPNPPYHTYLVKVEPLAKNWYYCYFID